VDEDGKNLSGGWGHPRGGEEGGSCVGNIKPADGSHRNWLLLSGSWVTQFQTRPYALD